MQLLCKKSHQLSGCGARAMPVLLFAYITDLQRGNLSVAAAKGPLAMGTWQELVSIYIYIYILLPLMS